MDNGEVDDAQALLREAGFSQSALPIPKDHHHLPSLYKTIDDVEKDIIGAAKSVNYDMKDENTATVNVTSAIVGDIQANFNGTDANGNNQVTSPYFGWDHTAVIYNGDLYGGQQVITDANGNSDRILPLKPGYAFGTANNPDGRIKPGSKYVIPSLHS